MNPRILVVEDEQAIRLALKGLLSREGYEVELAEDGERAVAKLASDEFDLVLTDLALGRGISQHQIELDDGLTGLERERKALFGGECVLFAGRDLGDLELELPAILRPHRIYRALEVGDVSALNATRPATLDPRDFVLKHARETLRDERVTGEIAGQQLRDISFFKKKPAESVELCLG